MQIIRRRQRHEVTIYHLVFEDAHGAGFSFPCDANGAPKFSEMAEPARENYHRCMAGNGPPGRDLIAKGVVPSVSRWTDDAVGLCNRCGREVHLSGFTNTCECGADYNMSGQELAPRSQWGEETGESLDEILSVDCGANPLDY